MRFISVSCQPLAKNRSPTLPRLGKLWKIFNIRKWKIQEINDTAFVLEKNVHVPAAFHMQQTRLRVHSLENIYLAFLNTITQHYHWRHFTIKSESV